MFPRDLLADLPEPRDDEPSSLRADIADELADHLQCAYRREVLKDGDAAAAQRRALDRFGDPQKLARRLWWQAMRNRLMRQRILSGLQWLVALTAMFISGAVFWQQSQLLTELRRARQEEAAQRQVLTAKLDRLQLPTATLDTPVALPPADPFGREALLGPPVALSSDEVRPLDPYDSTITEPKMQYDSAEYGTPPRTELIPPVLTLFFVQETQDGPSVAPRTVTLTNSDNVAHQGEPNVKLVTVPEIHQYPDGTTTTSSTVRKTNDNKVVFRGLEPDLYQLLVILADGQQSVRPMSIRDEKPRELTIICPGPRKKKAPVTMSIKPLPEALQKLNFEVRMEVGAAPVEIGQAKWTTVNIPWQRIIFDGQSGLPMAVGSLATRDGPYFALRELPADERRVFLPVGTVAYRFEAAEQVPAPSMVTVHQWPQSTAGEDGLRHTIKADEDSWEIDLPKEYLEEMLSVDDAGGIDPYGGSAAAGIRTAQPTSGPEASPGKSRTTENR